jgi:4-hydroxy-2-oxoheptanedioate aldolase
LLKELEMRTNPFRSLLQAGKPTFGTHLHSVWPSIIEVVGHTGLFDYVEFVGEYAPYDLHDLDNFCRAAELHDLATMIKVDQEPRGYLTQRAIGAGFTSVLFADCRTAEDVRAAVRLARPDTPTDGGTYGAAMRRNTYMGYGGTPEYVQAIRDVVVVVMIEKRDAVDQLEEIFSIDGIDMIQWGGADYSMSIGRAGERSAPDIKAVERRVIETGLRMGIPPRAEIASPDQAAYYLDLGVRHFCIGTDVSILFNWLKENGAALRRMVEGS